MNRPAVERESKKDLPVLRALGLRGLTVYFQPIVSLKSEAVTGYEGLIRGIDEKDGRTVPPLEVLDAAKENGLSVEADRLCRTTVMRAFAAIGKGQRRNALLFLNFESSLLNSVEAGNGYLLRQVTEAGLAPSDIVLELIESKVDSPVNLKMFVGFYRSRGFLIALDDVGSGYSNFDRIPHIRPDIIKVDRSIVHDIEKDYYRQEVFRSLRNLSRKIGTLLLAEGVETEEEALAVMDLDTDFIQGYFFAKPQPFFEGMEAAPQMAATGLRRALRDRRVRELTDSRREHAQYDDLVSHVWAALRTRRPEEFDGVLRDTVADSSPIEAVYILDEKGVQVSDTMLNAGLRYRSNVIFHCANRGDDLSLKEYFYLLVGAGMRKYTTDTYISLATGNQIRTISTVFTAGDGQRYVLCVDVSRGE